MKILTLNTHSLREENYQQKLTWFVEGILKERPDLIAMQEVNQSVDAEQIAPEMLEGLYLPAGCGIIRGDNHAAQVAYRLRQAGIRCSWIWVPIKLGYGKYDEGVAILSLGRKIRSVDAFPVSKCTDYQNWKTRKVLGVRLEGLEDWFYTVHMGRWDDETEPFGYQLKILNCCVAKKRAYGPVWLLGDFNAPSVVRGESYDAMLYSDWYDTFLSAAQKDDGITVLGVIDGWRDKIPHEIKKGMRLDYIWCSQRQRVKYSYVMFNGAREKVVSDHFGVMIETEEEEELWMQPQVS